MIDIERARKFRSGEMSGEKLSGWGAKIFEGRIVAVRNCPVAYCPVVYAQWEIVEWENVDQPIILFRSVQLPGLP